MQTVRVCTLARLRYKVVYVWSHRVDKLVFKNRRVVYLVILLDRYHNASRSLARGRVFNSSSPLWLLYRLPVLPRHGEDALLCHLLSAVAALHMVLPIMWHNGQLPAFGLKTANAWGGRVSSSGALGAYKVICNDRMILQLIIGSACLGWHCLSEFKLGSCRR